MIRLSTLFFCIFLCSPSTMAETLKTPSAFRGAYKQAGDSAREHARMGQYAEAAALLDKFRIENDSEKNAKYLIKRATQGAKQYHELNKLWTAAKKDPRRKLDPLIQVMLRRSKISEFSRHRDEIFRLLSFAVDKNTKVARIAKGIFPAILVINWPTGEQGTIEARLRKQIEDATTKQNIQVRALNGKWMFTLDLKAQKTLRKKKNQMLISGRCKLTAHGAKKNYKWSLRGVGLAASEAEAEKTAIEELAQEFTKHAALQVLHIFRHP